MEAGSTRFITCFSSIATCFILSIAYVASLYVWGTGVCRDHPDVIIRRFFSVFVVMCLSPPLVYMCMDDSILEKTSMLHLLGLRINGLWQASFYPLGLTAILFLGSLSMQVLSGDWRLYAEPMFWRFNFLNTRFLRNHVVAPIAEEFVFRACMMPLLMQCFHPVIAVCVAPLFFGVAHLHLMIERIRHDHLPFNHALIISCFQMTYTTIFGAYSAFLFVRTGHLAAPLIVHAFCNCMGFPDVEAVFAYKNPQKIFIVSSYLIGLLAWCLLLVPSTDPMLYDNSMYWKPLLL